MAGFREATASRRARSGTASPASTSIRRKTFEPFSIRFPSPRAAVAAHIRAAVPVPDIETPKPAGQGECIVDPGGFGKILATACSGLTNRSPSCIVTTSPDVTVSTNLGAWVNRRGIFDRRDREDTFKDEKVVSAPSNGASRRRASISSSALPRTTCSSCWRRSACRTKLFGARLLPIGTLYDPFIQRGLDALNYACYQDARFPAGGDAVRA